MTDHVAEREPWRPIGKEEWLRLLPYMLDCEDLSTEAVSQVRREFSEARVDLIKKTAVALGRVPTQAEADKVRATLTQHFNRVRIAEIAKEHGE